MKNTQPSANQFEICWRVVENSEDGDLCRSEMLIASRSGPPLGREGWTLYFNFARTIIPESVSPDVRITHVNGDFYSLSPAASFPPLEPGDSVKIPFDARVPVINETGAPSGLYFVFSPAGREARVEPVRNFAVGPFTTRAQTRRSAADEVQVPTPESRFEANRVLTLLPENALQRIVPTPVSLTAGRGTVELGAGLRVHHARGLAEEADALARALESLLGIRIPVAESEEAGPGVIRLGTGAIAVAGKERRPGDEAYRLTVDAEKGIEILGSDPAGVFYGIQSLRALLPLEALRGPKKSLALDAVLLEDAPRFSHRGLHLDVARNFQTKETVEKLLDLMAFYKLNRFHFHLTDDEGWRFAVKPLPELTAVGGRRGHTQDERDRLMPSLGSGPDANTTPGSGYYTREDFIEILRYAKRRHIEVLPEIDVPGHARAAIKAMDARYARLTGEGRRGEALEFLLRDPDDRSEYRSVQGWNDNVINVCMESGYRFLETVFDDVIEMYREAGAPLRAVHIGGDEVPGGVWEKSPACARRTDSRGGHSLYFLRRVRRILAGRKLSTAGWEEIALSGQEETSQVRVPNKEFVESEFLVYVWNSAWGSGGEENAYRLANAGYKVVLCNASNLYFDLAYEKHPGEPGQHWAGFVGTRKAWELAPFNLLEAAAEDLLGRPLDPGRPRHRARLTARGRRNVLGIQGQLWGEPTRSPEVLEHLAFPKILGLAERAWAEAEWETARDPEERRNKREAAWNRFANTLGQRELPRLDFLNGGVRYRIPPPGAAVRNGLLEANVAFPGLTLRYTTDGSEPTAASRRFTGPVGVSGIVRVRAFDTRGRSSRTSELR